MFMVSWGAKAPAKSWSVTVPVTMAIPPRGTLLVVEVPFTVRFWKMMPFCPCAALNVGPLACEVFDAFQPQTGAAAGGQASRPGNAGADRRQAVHPQDGFLAAKVNVATVPH